MLKIVGSVGRCIEKLESDYYIPFSVRFSERFNAHVAIWMLGKNNTVLEIACDNQIGFLEYVTLANIEKEKITFTDDVFLIQGVVVDGTPVCDVQFFAGRRLVRDKTEVSLVIGGDFLRVIISDNMTKKYYKTGKICIGVNLQEELCEIAMIGMLRSEIDIVKVCLGVSNGES